MTDPIWKMEVLPEPWTHAGFDCRILRVEGSGHLCGYVRIPQGHPLHGVAYNAPVPESLAPAMKAAQEGPICKRGVLDVFCVAFGGDFTAGMLFDVHGGITYSEEVGEDNFLAPGFWYGFDCAHSGDLCPLHVERFPISAMTETSTARSPTCVLKSNRSPANSPSCVHSSPDRLTVIRSHQGIAMPTKKYPEPQAFSTRARPAIALKPVQSSQVKAVGYDAQTQTLAVTFTHGAGAIYHYPNVTPEQHAAFIGADSIGVHFGKHIKHLAFEKFPAEPVVESVAP